MRNNSYFLHDLSIIVLSIVLALLMVNTNFLNDLLLKFSNFKTFGSLFAGLFFTSVFTTAPAIVTLGKIASNGSVVTTAFLGAIGAVIGDLVIFRFVRDRLTGHFIEIMKHEKWWKRVHHLTFGLKYFRWITFLFGGIILASPFPDELGISILGFSKMKTRLFIPISFVFNFMGILTIGFLAQNI